MKSVELIHQPGAPILSARIVLPLGSILDPIGMKGRQQLLAGVLTRGCAEFNAEKFASFVESHGANLRCEAGEDLLVIALKCNRIDANSMVPLILAMFESPHCNEEQINLERDLNIQMLKRLQEDPFQLCHDKLKPLLFDDGPYSSDPIGFKQDLKNIKQKNLLETSKQLTCSKALLVLAGDPPPELIENCRERLNVWKNEPISAPEPSPEPALNFASVVCNTEQVVLMMGFRTVGIDNTDSLMLRLLQVHLGVGMSCRLFQVIREERGLAYDVGVELMMRRSNTPMVWHLSCAVGRACEALDALLAEWQNIIQAPISEAELQLAVAKLKGMEALSRETGGQRADRLAMLLSYGLSADHNEICLKKLDRIEPAQLLAAAQRWLQKANLSICGPSSAIKELKQHWQRAQR